MSGLVADGEMMGTPRDLTSLATSNTSSLVSGPTITLAPKRSMTTSYARAACAGSPAVSQTT